MADEETLAKKLVEELGLPDDALAGESAGAYKVRKQNELLIKQKEQNEKK
jgi:hypothetical protein